MKKLTKNDSSKRLAALEMLSHQRVWPKSIWQSVTDIIDRAHSAAQVEQSRTVSM